MSKALSIAGAALAVALLTSPAMAGPAVTPLVSTDWLEDNLGAEDLVILDIRSEDLFESAHIPGSQHTAYSGEWNTEREGIPARLPIVEDLEAMLSRIGIGPDVTVVVVPAGTNSTEIGGATWIYWVHKYLGHDAVAILDGGYAEWEWNGLPTESGPVPDPEPRTFVASVRPELLAETDYVAERMNSDVVIVDARPEAQYTGATQSGMVTRAGHIPSAISLNNARFYDELFNRFKAIEGLEAELPPELADRSVQVITYCVAGHWGSINWFVLHELLGFENARLYEGSMAAWSRDESLPITLGDQP